MYRKLAITLGTVAIIAAAGLAPTTASAGWKHKHHHHHHGWYGGLGVYSPVFLGGPSCYKVKRLVLTKWGYKWRRVTVCE